MRMFICWSVIGNTNFKKFFFRIRNCSDLDFYLLINNTTFST